MGLGAKAYQTYSRIHREMGRNPPPDWESISHIRRLAWEAAAQEVAMTVLPQEFDPNEFEDESEVESQIDCTPNAESDGDRTSSLELNTSDESWH